MSRRKFLRDSAKVTGSLILPSWMMSCSAKHTASNQPKESNPSAATATKKLGVALIGLGYYSRDLLAPALQLTQHCELRGIVTGSPDKIPLWQDKYGIKSSNVYSYDNLDAVAENDEIDVLYIVTPTATHARFAIAAAKAGKHVWCEKPMAMDVAECQSIIDACKANKVSLSIGYRMQHEPNTQTVISYAKKKPYGDIQDLLAHSGYGGSPPTSGWRSQPEMGGGALYDMGVYAINALRYGSGLEPIAVRKAQQTIPDRVDVTTSFEMLFPGGIVAQGKTSVVENINQLRVNCEKGWYELVPLQTYTGVQGQTSDGTLLNLPIENQQAKQMDDDALSILNNTEVLVPGLEGLKDIRIVQAIKESAAMGGKEILI
ncbi:MAG: Gfo/Idh/MocA family oxidoreductase [Bacteroidota bacterium]